MHKKKILLGVSGGPDSMALLNILKKRKPIVAHVNYQKRSSSNKDEKIVRDFCNQNNLKLFVKRVNKKEFKDGNFQNEARKIRYNFFKEIYINNKCEALYLAHHEDDHIETFLIQQRRGGKVEYFGIQPKTKINDMIVKRILLSWTKSEILQYCKNKKINYETDQSNSDVSYLRNKIRKEIVSNLTIKERRKLLRKIRKKNKEKKNKNKKIDKTYDNIVRKNKINIKKIKTLDKEIKKEVLRKFISKKTNNYKISENNLLDMLRKLESNKANSIIENKNNVLIAKSYGNIISFERKEDFNYKINYQNPNLDSKVVLVKESNKGKFVFDKKNFPLYIEKNKGQYRRVNKLFIKEKIPYHKREKWPILLDKNKKPLLVIGIKLLYNDKRELKEDIVKLDIKIKKEYIK